MSGEQALFNLEIKKKSGLSINPDIHHSKVPSSDEIWKLLTQFGVSGTDCQIIRTAEEGRDKYLEILLHFFSYHGAWYCCQNSSSFTSLVTQLWLEIKIFSKKCQLHTLEIPKLNLK